MIIAPGTVDVITYFKLVDPATGVPETGLTISNLDATYIRDGAAAVKADLSTPGGYTVISAHTDNAAIQVDATNAPGVYRVDWPDAAFAVGVPRVQLVVNGVAIDPAVIEVELAAWLTPITGTSVGIDFNKVTQATAPTTLTNITVPVTTAVTNGVTISGTLSTLDAIWTKIRKFFQLTLRKDAAIATDNAVEVTEINASGGSGVGAYANTTDSQEAIRDRGDAAWITATGFSTFDSTTDPVIAGSAQAGFAQDMFTVNSGETNLTALDGSVVKEIMDGLCSPATFPAGAIEFTYTVTDSVTLLPIEGVEVWFSTDNPAVNIVWKGDTDAFGVARDVNGSKPWLDVGVYFVWRQRDSYSFINPDLETVS